jgi:beta-lactam-binding protein with PASTA domain
VQLGLTPRLVGDGFVIAQAPPPGAPLTPGSECKLVLGRLQARSDQDPTATP